MTAVVSQTSVQSVSRARAGVERHEPEFAAASTAAGAVTVGECDDSAAWDEFVRAAPDAGFFHLSGWKRVIERSLRRPVRLRAATRDGRIVGILPLVEVRSPLFGRSLTSVGFLVQGGVVAEDAAARRALADDAAALGRAGGVGVVELRHRAAYDDLGPDWLDVKGTYAGFRRPLAEDEDDLLKAIPRKKRADVRKGIKAAPRVDVDASIETFYGLYSESLRNLGTPVQSIRFYRAIRDVFGDSVEISAVHGPDGPVAALMSFYFRDEVLPYFGGASPVARDLHAYDYMYWTLMTRAAARGARVFDFGRSKYGTGAYAYKTYWGFEAESLTSQFLLVKARETPNVNPLNPRYRRFVDLWKKLPLSVANAVGPHIARHIG